MTQPDTNWKMETKKQCDEKQRKREKNKRDILEKQRQLTRQIMGDIECLQEETRKDRDEIGHLRKKVEQKQEDVDLLTAEKDKQDLLTQRLESRLENVIEKLEEDKCEARREQNQRGKTPAEQHPERETPETTRERHKHTVGPPDEPGERLGQRSAADRLVRRTGKKKKMMLEAELGKEKNMSETKRESKSRRDETEVIRNNTSENMKKMRHAWPETQRDEGQRADDPEGERRGRREGKTSFDTVKVKLREVQEAMEKFWDLLEEGEQEPKTETPESQNQRQGGDVGEKKDGMERIRAAVEAERENTERERRLAAAEESLETQRQQLDERLQRTKREMRELELARAEAELMKEELVKVLRSSRRKKQHAPHDRGERSEQLTEDNMADGHEGHPQVGHRRPEEDEEDSAMQRVSLEIRDIREMLRRVREETEKKRSHVLQQDQCLDCRGTQQRNMGEWEELETMATKRAGQREEVEEKMEHAKVSISTTNDTKSSIQKAAAEKNFSQEETRRDQERRKENEEEEEQKQVVSHFHYQHIFKSITSYFLFRNTYIHRLSLASHEDQWRIRNEDRMR